MVEVLGSSAQASGPNQPKKYKTTFLAYMNGFEKVVDPAVKNLIEQMESVGSSESTAIVVNWGSLKTGKAKRLFLEKDEDRQTLHSLVLFEAEDDMGRKETLEDFLIWGAQEYPADNLVVILGGHGAGWMGFSFDQRTQSKISIPDLGKALAKLKDIRGKKTDLVVFDACLMSMVEVASELAPAVKFMAAAMDKLPDDVWIPYDVALAEFSSSGTIRPEIIGSIFSRSNSEETKTLKHSSGIVGIQFGVIDLTTMNEVERRAKKFSSALMALSDLDRRSVIESSNTNSQKYFLAQYKDFAEWLSHIPVESRFSQVRKTANELREELVESSVYQSKSSYYPNSSGMTVAISSEGIGHWSGIYKELRWAKKTGWDKVQILKSDGFQDCENFGGKACKRPLQCKLVLAN